MPPSDTPTPRPPTPTPPERRADTSHLQPARETPETTNDLRGSTGSLIAGLGLFIGGLIAASHLQQAWMYADRNRGRGGFWESFADLAKPQALGGGRLTAERREQGFPTEEQDEGDADESFDA